MSSGRFIYIVKGGSAAGFRVTPVRAIAATAGLLALAGWLGIATIGLADRMAALSDLQADRAAELASRDARIAALEAERDLLGAALEGAQAETDALKGEMTAVHGRRFARSSTGAALRNEITALRGALATSMARRQDAEDRLATVLDETEDLRGALALARSSGAAQDEAISLMGETLASVTADRDRTRQTAERLDAELAALRDEVTWQNAEQERIVTQLEAAAKRSLEGFEDVFSEVRLDPDRFMAQISNDTDAQGGPFQALDGMDGGARETGDLRVSGLFNDLERISLMRVAMHRLPFARPVEGGRITSGFGPRRDPIRKRSSMHNGTDFKGLRGTPIFATAEGVVTFAGRQRGYGIVVKIKHAFGFETVYAHLSRARVKVGQNVARGDRIADMGSTGRSTGTHLHYEVRIDKKPVNPMTFIEAARDVL